MHKAPFERFIITLLLFNKSVPQIVEKLKSFGYYIIDDEVSRIFDNIRSVLPPNLTDLLNSGQIFNIDDESHIQWLKHFEIFEYYNYIINKNKEEKKENYFKWFDDCLWIHTYKDIMSLTNILIFNNESDESISDIIMVKYKRKVANDAFAMYRKMFWDTTELSAKEALYYCIPFRNNALVVRQFRSGETELETMSPEEQDGSDIPITFHDTSYIKWKIGYKKVEVPGAKEFLERIKQDSYFKYYETMNMTQSADLEEEEGSNDEFGNFDKKTTRWKNVEEQRIKLAKQWMDLYLKAEERAPSGGGARDDFFDRIDQLSLEFDDCKEQIATLDSIPKMMDDIKGDMQ